MQRIFALFSAVVVAIGLSGCQQRTLAETPNSESNHNENKEQSVKTANLETATFAAGCFGASRPSFARSRA